MTDFRSLDPTVHSCALVGNFLALWANMEAKIRDAIAKALGLSDIQSAIVSANIQLRDKVHILRTAVDLSPIRPQSEVSRFKSVLQSILDYAPTRNMMAHDMFGPSEDGSGVEFMVVKAKGKLQFPSHYLGCGEI